MNKEENDADFPGGKYPYTVLSQLNMTMESDDGNDSDIPVLGCLHLLLQGFMFCALEIKTVCADTINRRRHRDHDYYYTDAEAEVSLLTESMEDDLGYASEQVMPTTTTTTTTTTTPQQVLNLDLAMKDFVETNDSQALIQIFDVAAPVKDNKQD